ncbi:hypothetical protein SAMN05421507_104547 [Lentzea jiangxiensis]|uniref:Uncharacterized protein n=1 Tax=Lentzea jiangxiensis TaxID=641025 RepID=A0A1H0NV74_9PSEU|nr:hypothetical protein SAMN05421507_104547 [Lentzea jiangxiensis]
MVKIDQYRHSSATIARTERHYHIPSVWQAILPLIAAQ